MLAPGTALPNVEWPYTDILVRVALAVALGLLIGIERERRGKEAGLRTFGFICLLGALVLFDGDRLAGLRRLAWGGAAFGFAGAIKVWAILPVLVVFALTARRAASILKAGRSVAPGSRARSVPASMYQSTT